MFVTGNGAHCVRGAVNVKLSYLILVFKTNASLLPDEYIFLNPLMTDICNETGTDFFYFLS